ASIIVKSGNALLTIINDILDFSKIDAGELKLDPAPFNLTETVEDIATLVSPRANEKDLELIVRVDPGLPAFLVADAGRLRQVLTNLLGNAVKFTEAGQVFLDVSGAVADGVATVTFRVEDTGIGIPPEKLGAVFEKFSQVDNSSTRRHEGTGLGLAIAARLVAMMGGAIGVDSQIGRGSVFSFAIDLPVSGEEPGREAGPVEIGPIRVLIVDDNAVNRSILAEQMQAWRFRHVVADRGHVALAMLEQAAEACDPFDLVVLDYQMPGMTGEDVARAMRSSGALAVTPIVLLTSIDQIDFRRLMDETGVAASLTKPTRSSLLLSTISEVVARVRTGAETPPAPAPEIPRPVPVIAEDDLRQLRAGKGGGDAASAPATRTETVALHPAAQKADSSLPAAPGAFEPRMEAHPRATDASSVAESSGQMPGKRARPAGGFAAAMAAAGLGTAPLGQPVDATRAGYAVDVKRADASPAAQEPSGAAQGIAATSTPKPAPRRSFSAAMAALSPNGAGEPPSSETPASVTLVAATASRPARSFGEALREATANGPLAPMEHPVRTVTSSAMLTAASPVLAATPVSGKPSPDVGDILVAEDNEVNRIVYEQILSMSCIRFHMAVDGQKAVDAWREQRPRLILMDVSMPNLNGFEATAAIRDMEAETGEYTPIIGVTAHALKGDRERCIASGMDDYLSKPVSPDRLRAKLEEWLGGEALRKAG
nr:response regulator [Rhizobiaceae bacterium]